jgi:hypothetical protein
VVEDHQRSFESLPRLGIIAQTVAPRLGTLRLASVLGGQGHTQYKQPPVASITCDLLSNRSSLCLFALDIDRSSSGIVSHNRFCSGKQSTMTQRSRLHNLRPTLDPAPSPPRPERFFFPFLVVLVCDPGPTHPPTPPTTTVPSPLLPLLLRPSFKESRQNLFLCSRANPITSASECGARNTVRIHTDLFTLL